MTDKSNEQQRLEDLLRAIEQSGIIPKTFAQLLSGLDDKTKYKTSILDYLKESCREIACGLEERLKKEKRIVNWDEVSDFLVTTMAKYHDKVKPKPKEEPLLVDSVLLIMPSFYVPDSTDLSVFGRDDRKVPAITYSPRFGDQSFARFLQILEPCHVDSVQWVNQTKAHFEWLENFRTAHVAINYQRSNCVGSFNLEEAYKLAQKKIALKKGESKDDVVLVPFVSPDLYGVRIDLREPTTKRNVEAMIGTSESGWISEGPRLINPDKFTYYIIGDGKVTLPLLEQAARMEGAYEPRLVRVRQDNSVLQTVVNLAESITVYEIDRIHQPNESLYPSEVAKLWLRKNIGLLSGVD